MRALTAAAFAAVAAALAVAPGALADGGDATPYHLSLGDSYADRAQPNGDFEHGYAEQLHEILACTDPKLKLVKLGCSGESAVLMRLGDPSTAEDVAAAPWSEGGMPALQATVASVVGLNDFVEGFYTGAGIPFADVGSAFSVTDFTLVDGVPLNVQRSCQWSWWCNWVPPDVHPNTTGYGVIAQAFAGAIESA
jgi:hypothetical protein